MKFKTFMRIVIAGGILLLGGACYGCVRMLTASRTPDSVPPAQTEVSQVSATSTSAPVGNALTPLHSKIIGKMGQQIDDSKLQDAFPGDVKVNLYQDDKKVGINRAKLDLDRDDKWDEKWTHKDGAVKRQVSSSDDDKTYDLEFTLTDDGWVQEGESAPVATATQAGPGALRSFDQAILDKAGQKISGDKVKDALSGSVKVNLYQDNPGQGVNRAKLDLDRDDKFDEKWTFVNEGGTWKVKRQVSPADNEQYTEEYSLEGGRWVAR
ncbi:MAG: hypothetical protein AMXMBFR33_30110 [Candidatus Xenobia bacterium]|jgi:hypothetical protein